MSSKNRIVSIRTIYSVGLMAGLLSAASCGPAPPDETEKAVSSQRTVPPDSRSYEVIDQGIPPFAMSVSIPPQMFTQIREAGIWGLRPHRGQVVELEAAKGRSGYLLKDLGQFGILHVLSFNDGDVIEKLNGRSFDIGKATADDFKSCWEDAVNRLQRGDSTTVTFVRNGRRWEFSYTVKE